MARTRARRTAPDAEFRAPRGTPRGARVALWIACRCG